MSFSASWHTLLDECEALSPEAILVTPLTETHFRITDLQDHRIIIEFLDSGESQPLQRDQFETLADRITETGDTFDLQRLPPDAEPYAAVLSLHPRYECNERAGTLTKTDEPTTSQLITVHSPQSSEDDDDERAEPDLDLYADMLLLIDVLERHDPSVLDDCETPTLINLYTLLSEVQRNAEDIRQDVRELLLEQLHHDQPVHGQYGSVQRTRRRNRTLRDDKEVIRALEEAGIPRERFLGVDRAKVDDALAVTDLSDSAVYDIDERAYVRKAEVDEEHKATRLQGLKDQLALTDEPEADALRQEVAELEQRIAELTEFTPGTQLGSHS